MPKGAETRCSRNSDSDRAGTAIATTNIIAIITGIVTTILIENTTSITMFTIAIILISIAMLATIIIITITIITITMVMIITSTTITI